jgi:FG-GAP-like repeat/FG-GAP repeat
MRRVRSQSPHLVACLLVVSILGGCQGAHQHTAGGRQIEPDRRAIVRPIPILQPPNGAWLEDADGRKYFIDRLLKKRARRIDKKTVRTVWGVPIDVVKEDDKYYYYKAYKPGDSKRHLVSQPRRPSAEEVRRIRDSYKASVPWSERLRFASFGKGLPSAGRWRSGFAIADMNGDGHPDIVSGSPRESLNPAPVIFLGDGKGSWSRWHEVKFPPLAYDYGDVQVGDLNGDGHLDLVLGVHLRGVLALLGDGKGAFRDGSRGLPFSPDGKTTFSSQAVKIVDWNGDGKADILALSEGPGMIGRRLVDHLRGAILYLNGGDGTWKRSTERASSKLNNGLFGVSLAVGDFDGDGHPDFATSSGVMGRRDLVNLWRPRDGWQTVTVNEVRPMAYVWAVAAADFDGDGRTDLAVAYTNFELSTWRSGVDVLFSRAGGHWVRRTLVAEEGINGPVALATGDLDGDGHKDLVALTAKGDTLVFLGDGKGSFTRERTPPPAYPGNCSGTHVQLADLDGSGRDEVIAAFGDQPEGKHCPSGGGLTVWKAQSRSGTP